MAKDKIKTENVNIDNIDETVEATPEKAGAIYRVCYLQDGINEIILDNKVQESVQCHTTGEPNKKKVATLTRAQAEEIAKIKMPDLNAATVEAATEMIKGTARSMGIVVED